MIDNYDEIMASWESPHIGCCSSAVDVIIPDDEMTRWAVQKTVTILANADYYYTKKEVDDIISKIIGGGMTPEEVQAMIDASIRTKADASALTEVQDAVASILNNTYTKEETNSLLNAYLTITSATTMTANYSKVDGTTLLLNAENIGIII